MINLAKIELMKQCMEYLDDFKKWVEEKEGTGKKEFVDRWVSKSDPNVVEVDCMNLEKKDPPFNALNVCFIKAKDHAFLKVYVVFPDNKQTMFDLSMSIYFAFDSEHMKMDYQSFFAP